MVCSYIAQYHVLRTAQSALHSTSLTDLFNQTSQLGSIHIIIRTCPLNNSNTHRITHCLCSVHGRAGGGAEQGTT